MILRSSTHGSALRAASLLALAMTVSTPAAHAATFHVDDDAGADARDGRSPTNAWRTLERVNAAELQPGDRVLFHRGGTWRGQLVPHSGAEGAPIVYGAYGEGPKPLLLGSVAFDRPEDWQPEGSHIWATAAPTFVERATAVDPGPRRWGLHTEGGARVDKTVADEAGAPCLRMRCEAAGTAPNHVQLILAGLAVRAGDAFVFEFRAMSTTPFRIPHASLTKTTSPWTSYATAAGPALNVETNWTTFQVLFRTAKTADDGRITLYLGGTLPAGATFAFQPLSWKQRTYSGPEPLSVDVGNIIFDDGPRCGVKKWNVADLKQPGDFCYTADDGRVRLCAEANPASLYHHIELALRRHIIDEGNRHDVVYEDLALRYGAAHGIGGAVTHHIRVSGCDIAFIGGGHQMTRPDGKPVRFGNGVEFWSDAHDNLVERCRIWEIYDAALTNQGDENNEQRNIVYRDNTIWNSEYSFEYWNRKGSRTRDILFEHNTCVDAGRGWGHTQRPDPNGRHLMFYQNSADTQGVVVRENIFSGATESCLRMCNDWTAGLALERNCWFQPQGVLVLFLKTPYPPEQFDEYRKQTGLDAHSIAADPQFRAAAALDFGLAPGSPAATLAADGGPAGARQRLGD